jgi:multidrug resistance efflux pump
VARETKYYLSRYNIFNTGVKARTMFEKTKPCEKNSSNQQAEAKKRIEAALENLRALKSRTAELRAQIEELQKTHAEPEGNVRCDECGDAIEPEEEVEAKNFSGKTQHYHRECFRKLWQQCSS